MKRVAAGWVREARFTYFYHTNRWADSETRSGPGSRRDSGSALRSLEVLAEVTERFEIRSIADIPCGDFNWIEAHLTARPEVQYIGLDIVAHLVRRNRKRFPGRKFSRLDIVTSVPPVVDLIFCKDLLNHLTNGEIIDAIENMRQSRSGYLLATNNFGYMNEELDAGKHGTSRHIDLTTEPLCYIQPLWHDHYLSLWRLEEMKRFPGCGR